MRAVEEVSKMPDTVTQVVDAVEQFIDPACDKDGTILVENAEKLAEQLVKDKMTTTQVRNLYAAAKRINYRDENGPFEASMLRAKFAYTAGRYPAVRSFQSVADKALKCADSEEKFDRFMCFFEAVVAYHRAFGGRE